MKSTMQYPFETSLMMHPEGLFQKTPPGEGKIACNGTSTITHVSVDTFLEYRAKIQSQVATSGEGI